MSTEIARPNAAAILSGLKDFQRQTVDYVYRRLYTDPDPVRRFLIADEVGLGKTLVARGIIARAVESMWDSVNRIDIIYICSNAAIARQNVNKLNITGNRDVAFATRMTLLPRAIKQLHEKLNFVSFTPGTSFNMGNRGGMADERAIIYHMLRQGWQFGSSAGPKNVFQAGKGRENWRVLLDEYPDDEIDPTLAQAFLVACEATPDIRCRFNDLVRRFAWSRKPENLPDDDRNAAHDFIADLRRILARSCVSVLQPDLVILDEFQRFKDLLDESESNEVANLARSLFNYSDARVLLLSATPYKMYTLHGEPSGEDHYEDFVRTTRFLLDSGEASTQFQRELERYRRGLLRAGASGGAELQAAKQRIEQTLRRVMVRTERLSVTTDRDGMLTESRADLGGLEPGDLKEYAMVDRVARRLGANDAVEYWKSAPYLLNTMDAYKLKESFVKGLSDPSLGPELAAYMETGADRLLQREQIRQYRQLDPGNAKLRTLLRQKVDVGAWKLLWVPPSLPYYRASHGPYADPNLADYTKALVFSAWNVVPKTIAMLCSYEAERQMITLGDADADFDTAWKTHGGPLRFALDDGRPAGMAHLTLLYPCLTLARRVDPLKTALDLTKGGVLPTRAAVEADVQRQVAALLEPVLAGAEQEDGPMAPHWYSAVLARLDAAHIGEPVGQWLADSERPDSWRRMMPSRGQDRESRFVEHVDQLLADFAGVGRLGRQPDDLVKILTKVAIASPAVVCLRALLRSWPVADADAGPVLTAAARMAFGFRSLFNMPDSSMVVRGLGVGQEARYWEGVLDYCADGNIQAVVDEYLHVLRESLGVGSLAVDAAVRQVAEEIQAAMSLRTVSVDFDEVRLSPDGSAASLHKASLRCRFALRLGDGRDEEDGQETRADQVRLAFSSPFRPFVLASTSVGQEGLDFHQYCHDIYHWNLPANPVDLEQREGRVHRYKGHVIRRNVAKAYPLSALVGRAFSDPWERLFEQAREDRGPGQNDLVPYWIFEPGGHKIVRHVPALPLSRELQQLEDLRNTVVAYRMVLGQPRQEDLVSFLRQYAERHPEGGDLASFRIDLSPPGVE